MPIYSRWTCTFLLLVSGLLGGTCQEETAENWEKISRLIPTNSVYKQQEKNTPPLANNAPQSLLRSLDENKVLDASKSDTKQSEHEEEVEEETYDDSYEVEKESKPVAEDTIGSKITDSTVKKERSFDEPSVVDEEDLSRDEDYLEDPSTSQYDAYYYYDDYDSNNRSRYEAIVDAEALDYPDAEEQEKEQEAERKYTDKATLKVQNTSLVSKNNAEIHEQPSSSTSTPDVSSDPPQEENNDPSLSTTNLEQGSSMEGSDKTFTILELPRNTADTLADSSILIAEAVVSVVTTKSVVNGTISVPTTPSPTTTEQVPAPPSSSSPFEGNDPRYGLTQGPVPEVTTEVDSSRILASVQTSRSISGARFLPFPVIDRVEQIGAVQESKKSSPPPESTESIIDKLDRVQSELSSGFLAGGFRTAGNTLQLDVLGDRNGRRRFTTTARIPIISKFVPRRYSDKRSDHTSSTPKARLETTLDGLEGLLPRDFVTRTTAAATATTTASTTSKTGFRWPSSKATLSTVAPEPRTTSAASIVLKNNKSNAIVQDISAFLPPGYKLKKEDASVTESSVLGDILAKSKVDISSLLPPDYDKRRNNEDAKGKNERTTTVRTVETSSRKASLEKLNPGKSIQDLFAKSEFDISSLLPRDYQQKKTNVTMKNQTETHVDGNVTADTTSAIASSTTQKPGGLKIVFPSRPGGRKPIHKITTPHAPRGDAPIAVTPKIQRGWPTRATTEFTGWPTPSTTPISIEKLLEAARTATVASVNTSLIPITSEISSTSTTSTTTTTARPTTPGICQEECEVAGTIRIVGNATWVPELFDRNTQEWQQLANEIEKEMNFIFSKSAVLTNWFKKIRIDSFSQGSVLVDYFVELAHLHQTVNTQELKVIFHDALRTYSANRWNDTSTRDVLRLGMFTIDPKYTDFVVIPKVDPPQDIDRNNMLIPQWAIAVIVIGVGGLLFVIIFGVSILVNRQNGSKLKPSMSTIYEEEVAKNIGSHRSSDCSKPVHTIWTDPDVSWNDKSFESTSNKVLVDKSLQDNKKYNLYDSWRSEWNGYYYNPSHGSSKYGGYDSTTNLSNRHHPDYDTNF
ncbi:hypothetical protein KM043_017289 [Ampulex compressa]|nr:hypothetical protein KM043_017289 [Ampulex compressa]